MGNASQARNMEIRQPPSTKKKEKEEYNRNSQYARTHTETSIENPENTDLTSFREYLGTSSTPTAPTSPRTSSVRSWPTCTSPTRTRSPSSVSAHSTVVVRAPASLWSTTPPRPSRSSSPTTVSSVSVPLPRSRRLPASSVCFFSSSFAIINRKELDVAISFC